MAVQTIVTKTHPTLRKTAQPVTEWSEEVETIIADLLDTLNSTGELGMGLSANQIDRDVRIFVARSPDVTLFINPEITWQSVETTLTADPQRRMLEGCLSLPDIYAFVERPLSVTMTYHTPETLQNNAVRLENTYHADDAIVVQHELDHLNGILFTDLAIQQGQKIYEIKEGEEAKLIELI